MPNDNDPQLPIDQKLRRNLRSEKLRTGISSRAMLAGRVDIPTGLVASHINRWASGVTKSAPADHVEYVLQLWSSFRDDAGRIDNEGNAISRPGRRHPKAGESWITITDEMREALRVAMRKNRITVKQLVEMDAAPPELTTRMINAWLYGDSATARKSLWDYTFTRCDASL